MRPIDADKLKKEIKIITDCYGDKFYVIYKAAIDDAPKLDVTGSDSAILVCQANCKPKKPKAKFKNCIVLNFFKISFISKSPQYIKNTRF